MGFNSAFKGLITFSLFQVREIATTDGAEFGKNVCVCYNLSHFFKLLLQ